MRALNTARIPPKITTQLFSAIPPLQQGYSTACLYYKTLRYRYLSHQAGSKEEALFVALVALVALVAVVADVLFYQKGRRQERNDEHKLLNAVRCMRSLDSHSDVIVYTEDKHSGKERDSCVLVKYPAARE